MRERAAPRAGRPHAGGDSGQATVEFVGMLPVIAATLAVLWQCALLGYAYSLAGDAADRAAREAAVADPGERDAACRRAGAEGLPAGWRESAAIDCGTGPGVVTARARIEVPLLFPGLAGLPFAATGEAAAAREG